MGYRSNIQVSDANNQTDVYNGFENTTNDMTGNGRVVLDGYGNYYYTYDQVQQVTQGKEYSYWAYNKEAAKIMKITIPNTNIIFSLFKIFFVMTKLYNIILEKKAEINNNRSFLCKYFVRFTFVFCIKFVSDN